MDILLIRDKNVLLCFYVIISTIVLRDKDASVFLGKSYIYFVKTYIPGLWPQLNICETLL